MSENKMATEMTSQDSTGYLPPQERRGVRACFTNGLTTDKTYLIVAVNRDKPEYNALGVRPVGSGYKLHFWPNTRAFGNPEDFAHLNIYDRTHRGDSNDVYQGGFASQPQLVELLKLLRLDERMDVAPEQYVLGTLQRGFDPKEHATV